MKKKFLLKGLLVSFTLLCSAQTWAYDFEVDNIQYTITSFDDMTVEVSGLTDTDVTEVIIPETVEYRERTLTVTSIASKVFQSNETLETACISNTVTSIGTYAFDGCTALKKVSIGDGVTSIGSYAFRNCTSLLTIIIPDFVTSISSYTFYGCSSLTEATIPNSVTNIGDYAFAYCSSLPSVPILNSVTSIGNYAFEGCSSFTSVEIPDNVTSIGSYVFSDCSSLTEVTFPNSITSIVSGMFEGCSSLAEVTIPNSVTSIGDYAFENCSSLKELYVPDSVTELGTNALVGCNNLESLSVGVGLTELCEYFSFLTFSTYNLGALRYRPLLWTDGPNQMKNIILRDDTSSFATKGYYDYYYRNSPKEDGGYPIFSNIDVNYFYVGRPLTNIKDWTCYVYYYVSSPWLENITISVSQPYGLIHTLEIGGYCTEVPYFYQSIENLILGDNVETYKVSNIYKDSLKGILCKSTTPPTLSGTFDNSTYLNVVLYVPIGSKEAYQAADGWRNFWDIIEMDVDDMTPEFTPVRRISSNLRTNVVGYYTVSGQKITTPQKGINIVRYSDGTTRKILVQ